MRMTTKRIDALQVGDVILGIGDVVFTDSHTVTSVTVANNKFVSAKTDRGGFYPNFMRHHIAVVG
jgi:hypothetical protein